MAKCIVCACTDQRACEEGCYWMIVNHAAGKGVCSSCAGSSVAARVMLTKHLKQLEEANA